METEPTVIARLRSPQQGRSKASFERMLATAETLMAERGSDNFTLNEVARIGKVSIGSIYCRFDSKDDLIHAVHVRVLARVDGELLTAIAAMQARRGNFAKFVQLFVEAIAEGLRSNAPILRPFMLRASSDRVVAGLGRASYETTAEAVEEAFMVHRSSIRHADPERAVNAAFRMLYASLARYLGFGSSMDFAGEGDWVTLKADLADMILAYLHFLRSQSS